MVSLKEKYTDMIYASKEELTDLLEYHAIETVWDDIREYRRSFQVIYKFSNQTICFTLTPMIYQKVIETERELRNVVLQMEKSRLYELQQDIQQFEYEVKRFLLQNASSDYELQKQLLHTHPLLFVILMRLIDHDESKKLAKKCLQVYHFDEICGELLQISEDIDYQMGEDQTDFLLRFLQRLQLFSHEQNSTRVNENILSFTNEQADVLCFTYPMLARSLIAFFVEHRQWNQFYSVKDYQTWNDCSYETARSSLNELVRLGWYKKIKVGKKFVYGMK